MGLFHRRDAPPSDLLGLLEPDERVLAWADVAGGGAVLATPLGLWWPAPDGPRRIGWQFVIKATWRDGRLSVIEADLVDELLLVDRPPLTAEIERARDLPPTVRKRVEANVVRSQVLPIAGGSARFVARRVPGQDGLRWWARLEDGTRDSAAVRSALALRVAELRAAWDEEQAAQRW
jgi:hypothetical protein